MIRLRVTLFPELEGAMVLRTKNMRGNFVITVEDGRAEIRAENEPGVGRDTSAMLGAVIKLEVEAT